MRVADTVHVLYCTIHVLLSTAEGCLVRYVRLSETEMDEMSVDQPSGSGETVSP